MKLNAAVQPDPVFTHEHGRATPGSAIAELRRSVLTCMLWEDSFYEKGSEVAQRIAELLPKIQPRAVAALAIEARDKMNLRHVPLYLLSELSKTKDAGAFVAEALEHVIQRADELSEFLAIYWKDKRHPLSRGVKRGLRAAFLKFDEYALSKYNRDAKVKLRDVAFLCHVKPQDVEQGRLFARLTNKSFYPERTKSGFRVKQEYDLGEYRPLAPPDTWEVALSAGADKKETFERLLRERKLGGIALLSNLRNMIEARVDDSLIRERLSYGAARVFPYRFVVAAKFAPRYEDAIEQAMFRAVEKMDPFPGSTGILIDVSGSMDCRLNKKASEPERTATSEETSRIDVACGLAILLREKAQTVRVATFSEQVVELPPRRGFALRDGIKQSQEHRGTLLRGALDRLKPYWAQLDRVIVITDEQSDDGIADAWLNKSYVVNVASYRHGVSYRNRWNHIDGWSEYVLDYIREFEVVEELRAA